MGKRKIDIEFKSLSPGIKDLLLKKEVTDQESLERLLDPSFEHFRKADEAMIKVVEKIEETISQKKNILIWGDQDMDGITACLLMKKTMQKLTGYEIETYIPKRREEGYGLSEKGIKLAIERGIDIIITVDCGIASFEEVEYLLLNNLDVIITDHHEPKENLPKGLILNPKLGSFGYRDLSGAGVAFKLADALFASLTGKTTNEWVSEFSEIPILAMIGIIGDRVTQLDENRILLCEGAKLLEKTRNPALSLLRKIGSIEEAIEPLYSGTEKLTWRFFNASTESQAEDIYSELEAKHTYWSFKAGEQFSSLKSQLDAGHMVLFDPDLDREFSGTIANRARDYTKHPVFVIYMTGEHLRGEGRGPSDFDLLAILDSVSDLLIDYGGHKVACGFTLKESKVEEFRSRVSPELEHYEPRIHVDAKVKLKEITPELQDFIRKIKPFGKGNAPPIFQVENVKYTINNGLATLSDGENSLKLDRVREMPPPSKMVNVYMRLDGEKVYLLRWEWVEDKNKDR